MGYLKNFLNKITNGVTAKRYTGIMDTGTLPSTKQTVWGATDYLTANEISLYLNRAIDKRAEKVAETEWYMTDERGNRIENDPLINVLYKPNKVFTGREFWKLYQKYYDLVGEVYIYVERSTDFVTSEKNISLHLILPTTVKPVFNHDGTAQKYEVKTGTTTIEYKPEEIIYIHNPNPKTPLRGMSLIQAGVHAVQTEVQINQYQSKVLENGGKVEGVFTFKTAPLTKEQLTELKDKYQKEYGAAKKAGMPLFLGGDATYTKTGLTPDELSYLESKKMTLDDICILTGVPKALLSSVDEVKYDNAEASRAIFLSETIRPLVETLRTNLDEKLAAANRNLKYVDPTPENIDRKIKLRESGIKNYYMSINEAREDAGLDPVIGGDDILVPFNLVKLGTEKVTEDTKAKKKANVQTKEHPLADPEIRSMYAKIQLKKSEQREKNFKTLLDSYFKSQEERVIQNLGGEKAVIKNVIDDALNINLEVNIGKEKFMPFLVATLTEAGIDALELGGSDYEFNLTAEIRTWLDSKADIFLNTINETTLRQLKDTFEESLGAGESRDDLVKRIRDTYDGISKARAEMIARTELHSINQYGTYKGYKQAGLNTKIWVSVVDSETRGNDPKDEADHLALDGEEVPIDTPFSNGLMYPGEVGAPAAEVINCRCQI